MRKFNQVEFARSLSLGLEGDLGNGACLILTLKWLKSRTEFWKEVDNALKSKSLINPWFNKNVLPTNWDYQAGTLPLTTELMANDIGRTFVEKFGGNSSFFGTNGYDYVCGTGEKDNKGIVFKEGSNYFLLGLHGAESAHVVGFYREYHTLYTSKKIYAFDSNSGEYTLDGMVALRDWMTNVLAASYQQGLGSRWNIWSFK